jgi:CheY-like chemotaxis protein
MPGAAQGAPRRGGRGLRRVQILHERVQLAARGSVETTADGIDQRADRSGQSRAIVAARGIDHASQGTTRRGGNGDGREPGARARGASGAGLRGERDGQQGGGEPRRDEGRDRHLAVTTERPPARESRECTKAEHGRRQGVRWESGQHLQECRDQRYIAHEMPPPPASPPLTKAPPARKAVLWVDDEADLLESHRIFLGESGYDVEMASNADDAIELLRRRAFDVVLLDEQMPGKRGLEAYRELRELAPNVPVVMVTKSEEDATLTEAIGANVRDYLTKPINPRQVLAAVRRILDGPRIRQQAMARRFVERFRAIELERARPLNWRGWVERYSELMVWDVELAAAGETGLYESLRGLYADMHREFAAYMAAAYPAWLEHLEGDRPPLSVDVIGEFLLPVLQRHGAAVFVVVDCLRLDQWLALEPLLAPLFDVEVTHHFAVLPTATPYSRNALFSGLFPGEIAARFPDWWGPGVREDETLNAHERELLEAQLAEAGHAGPVRYAKISTAADSDELDRRLNSAIAPEGVSAFVFNFVDLLTHGRSESAILYEVARDEIALRQLTVQWFQRSALLGVLKEAARRKITVVLTSDHGSIHCQTPATVYAKRDATANLRYKFGEDVRAERSDQALMFPNADRLRLPHRGMGAHTLLATGDSFFVYPTKLREYQSRYRGSFLHGGVTPEEMILPVALLTPRR